MEASFRTWVLELQNTGQDLFIHCLKALSVLFTVLIVVQCPWDRRNGLAFLPVTSAIFLFPLLSVVTRGLLILLIFKTTFWFVDLFFTVDLLFISCVFIFIS